MSERRTYPEPEALSSVAAFHQLFKVPVLDSPQVPDAKRCELRISLLSEELKELENAIKDQNLVEITDAFADLQYVLSGAILEFGLADKFKELFDEVHRSNMSKSCQSEEEAKATVEFYLKEKGTESHYEQQGDEFLVYRKSDNKVLKSVNYSPADLKNILGS